MVRVSNLNKNKGKAMNVLTNQVSRYLYALPFGVFGIMHFMNAGAMAGMVPFPGGAFWIYLTGLALLAASISIIIEKKVRLAGLLLGIMLLIFVLSIHLPGVLSGGEAATSSMPNLLKDAALAGAAWYIAGNYGEEAGGDTSAAERSGSEFGGGSSAESENMMG